MSTHITVADCMTSKIISITPETDIGQAVKKLLEHKITSLPVVDEHNKLLGVFSELDGIKMVLECTYNQSCHGKVGDVMCKDLQVVDVNDSMVDVAQKFRDTQTRSFPVFKNGALIGMISRVDVLRALFAMG